MSLKHFHLIFLIAATLLCGGFSWWCFQWAPSSTEESTGITSIQTWGWISLGLGAIVFVYLIWFLLTKWRKINL